ncbi:hypothetical protein U0070_007661, partial [Myodes glareolus]
MPGTLRPSNSTLVDELELSFEVCFASLLSHDYVLEDINVQHKKPAESPRAPWHTWSRHLPIFLRVLCLGCS